MDDQALRRRAEGLAVRRRALAGRSGVLRTDLARTRLLAAAELADGLRRLRDDSRCHLDRADAAARRVYPELLAAGVAELGRRHRLRTRALLAGSASRALAGLVEDPVDLRGPVESRSPAAPVRLPPGPRWPAEERLMVFAGMSAVVGLIRLAWAAGPLPPGPTVGISVAVGFGVLCGLVGARRAAGERARLAHWTHEVLGDTRAGLDAAFAEQALAAERRIRAALERAAVRLDAEVTAHHHRVRSMRAGRPTTPDRAPEEEMTR
ncbi:MAG: hypothetical protein ACT4O0_00105 [Pseudonocardia sp.]